jgi:hypothetical protein
LTTDTTRAPADSTSTNSKANPAMMWTSPAVTCHSTPDGSRTWPRTAPMAVAPSTKKTL